MKRKPKRRGNEMVIPCLYELIVAYADLVSEGRIKDGARVKATGETA